MKIMIIISPSHLIIKFNDSPTVEINAESSSVATSAAEIIADI